MISSSLPDDIHSLSIPERIELATAIWDSVAEETASIPLSDEQKQELDRRLAACEADPQAGESWQSLKNRLLAKK